MDPNNQMTPYEQALGDTGRMNLCGATTLRGGHLQKLAGCTEESQSLKTANN